MQIFLASTVFYPPSLYCSFDGCENTTPLKRARQQAVVFFSLAKGILPAFYVHLICDSMYSILWMIFDLIYSPECSTHFYHDYYVRQGRRHYYRGVPEVIQIAGHQFIETRLVSHFISLMRM